MAATGERTWHVGTYEPLAWAETAVKAAAFVCAYVAFVQGLVVAYASIYLAALIVWQLLR